jgi:predicted nucleic acid-binding protein
MVMDTQILIYAIEKTKHVENEQIHIRAKRFVGKMQEEGHRLVLPSVVVAEYLVSHEFNNEMAAYRALAKQFVIAPFDARTATIFGPIYRDKGLSMIKEDCPSKKCRRRKISVDCQVVATAIACRADWLIAHDSDIHRLGEGLVEVKEIPVIPEQLRLIDPKEAK